MDTPRAGLGETIIMNRLCLYILTVVLVCSRFAGGADSPLAEKARVLLDYQPYMRGDRDGAVRFSLSSSRDLQDTALAELAVRMALFYSPAGLSNVTVGEVEARRILNSESDLTLEHRDSLRRFVARSFATSGRRDDAMQLHARRGLVMSWLAAGPFPARSGGLAPAHMPKGGELIDEDIIDNPPDEEQFATWKKRPPWRRIPENRAFPFVRPWRGTGRDDDGSMVLFSVLDMRDADNQAFFHIYAETSWRLYIGGALVAEVDRNRREAPTEHMVQYSLSPGKHQVLLHLLPPPLDVDRKEVRVALRLESESGFTWNRDLDEPSIGRFANSRREARPLRFLSDLAKMAEQSPTLMVTYALACREQGMLDTAAWWAEKAARAQPDDAVIALNAGLCLSDNPLLPPARRMDMAKEWHSRALASRPDLVPSLLYLAKIESAAGNVREAREYIERAYMVNPVSLDVLVARSEWASNFASNAKAREAWLECGRAFPDSPSVQIAIASMPREGFLDIDRRLNACRQAVEAAPYMPEANLILAEALADSGNAQEADSVLKGAVDLFSGNVPVLVEIAEIYSRLGMHAHATRIMADAVRVTPDNDRLWRQLGDMHMAAGDKDAAEKYWNVSLAANPGQFQLSDMIAYLDGRPPRVDREGERDAIALTADAEWQRYDGDVVRLLDRAVLTFAGDGSYRRLSHEVDLALTRVGGEMLTGIDEGGELLTARIVFPNGNTLEPEPFPGPGGLRLPVIIPGASRELRALESTASVDGTVSVAPWFFQDPNGVMSLLHSEYIVRAPRNFPLVYAVRNLGNDVEFEQTREEDMDVYRWSANLSRPRREPDAVHISERVAMIEIGVKTNWDDIVAAELRKLDGKLVPSVRMRTLLETLIRTQSGRPNPLQAAKTIYRFVCDNIDPTPAGDIASHIYADRMGNRSLLLLSLLRAAGLDAHPASARPSELFLHPPTWELPKREIFTIPMVRLDVPGDSVYWLDSRFDSLPFGKITDDLSGATVLTFKSDGPLFETLPTLPAEDSLIFKERIITLPAGEDPLVVSGRSLRRGVTGLLREQALDDADGESRKNLLLTSIFTVFPDAKLRQFDVQRTDDTEASSLERYEIESQSTLEGRPEEGVRALPLCLAPPSVISGSTRKLRRRQTACHIKTVHLAEDRNHFRLPEKGIFTRLPKPAHIPSRFGVYQLRVLPKGNHSLEVVRNYHVPAQRIMPGDWADFLDFLEQVDLAEKQWIEYAVQSEMQAEEDEAE